MCAIIASVTPPDEGGGIDVIVCPRYVNSSGVRHFALYFLRSARVTRPPSAFICAAIACAVGPS